MSFCYGVVTCIYCTWSVVPCRVGSSLSPMPSQCTWPTVWASRTSTVGTRSSSPPSSSWPASRRRWSTPWSAFGQGEEGAGGVCYTCSLRGRGMCIRGRQRRVSAWGKKGGKDSAYHVLVKSHCERSFCAFQTQCTCTLHVCTNYMYTI